MLKEAAAKGFLAHQRDKEVIFTQACIAGYAKLLGREITLRENSSSGTRGFDFQQEFNRLQAMEDFCAHARVLHSQDDIKGTLAKKIRHMLSRRRSSLSEYREITLP